MDFVSTSARHVARKLPRAVPSLLSGPGSGPACRTRTRPPTATMGGGEGTSRKRRSSPSSGEVEGRGRKRRDNKESRGRIRYDREEDDDIHKKRKKGKHSNRERGKERYSKDRHSKEEEERKRKDKDAASSPMTFKEISKDDYFAKGAATAPRRRPSGIDGAAAVSAAGASASPSLSDGSWEGMARNRHLILGFIYGYYEEAVNALPLEHIPALTPRLLDAGICFGFGEPITNIIANTLCFLFEGGEPAHGEPPGGARKQKRKLKASRDARERDEVLSKIVAGNVPSPPEAQSIAERSLEGLVTFLTSYYCYLPTWDALRYLCLSRADLLVAVRLIEADRCYHHRDKFRIRSQAVKIALKCAALSARLPNIDAFVNDSAALVSHLTRIMPAQSRRRLSIQDVARFATLLEKPLELKKSTDHMHLAAMRCHQYDMKVPPALTESLRSILLDRIHVVYLTAISRIPMDDFRSRHHHGLLKAGYCYGPFSPILNVIASTVWYDTAFPAPEAFKLDMVCTRLLIHIESRSLDGLISLFLACTSDFSEHDAMVYLLKSNMELPRAIQMAGQDGFDMASLNAAAFKAAADASSHPQLEAYLHFVMESLPMVQPAVIELLSTGTETLSSSKIHHLSTLLSSSGSYPCKSLKPTDELTKDALEMVSRYKEDFFSQQNFFRKKVEATLKHYEKTEELYELRFICTVNQNVGKKDFTEIKYPYSHINFWASPKDETNLTLFFAQVSNDDEDKEHHWSFCQPVSILSKNARCCYCEFEGTRILHPSDSYCGGAMDFEKIALRAHDITNAQIISHGKLVTCPVGVLGEDYVYFDPFRDVQFVKAMNRTVLLAKLDWGNEMKRIRLNREDEIKRIKSSRGLKSLRQVNAC